MAKQLIELVLPRLARPLYHHLQKYQMGEMSESQFTQRFEKILQKEHARLSGRGIEAAKAAVAIHAAVLVLSLPGLRAEAVEDNLPLEVLEMRAIREAANDIASSYGMDSIQAVHHISQLVAKYAQ